MSKRQLIAGLISLTIVTGVFTTTDVSAAKKAALSVKKVTITQ